MKVGILFYIKIFINVLILKIFSLMAVWMIAIAATQDDGQKWQASSVAGGMPAGDENGACRIVIDQTDIVAGVCKFDRNVTALAVLAKIQRFKHKAYQRGCSKCQSVAHSDGWYLRKCSQMRLLSGGKALWYITHIMQGTYMIEGEFTWPLL